MDTLTNTQRSQLMSRIRDRNTKPEMAVRRLVHGLGFRYRLHVRNLPGCPDLVFSARQKTIFVHGCYWHRHNCPKGRSVPTTNRDFWETKFAENRARDQRSLRKLTRTGWRVLVVWECQLKRLDSLVKRLQSFLAENL